MNLGWSSREKKLALGFLALLFLMGSIFVYNYTALHSTETTPTFSTYPNEDEKLEVENVEKEEEEILWIDLKGAVMKPGVYQLPAQSRLFDVVEMAGGFTETAEKKSVNLAERLQDGQMIYIPQIGEANVINTSSTPSQASSNLISINRATQEQLTQLPGIGPSRAAAIVAYREEHGRFKKKEDIMQISGIGEKIFAQIKEHILIE